MKKLLTATIALCLILTGCSGSIKPEEAKNVRELRTMMEKTADLPLYSECENDEDLLFCFDLLDVNEYMKVTSDGSDYLLFNYEKSSMDAIENIDKIDNGNGELSLNIDVIVNNTTGYGSGQKWRVILRLDDDYDHIKADDHELYEYDGGVFDITGGSGLCDKDLNIIIPPIYGLVAADGQGNYRVENDEYQLATFDSTGKQLTDFA